MVAYTCNPSTREAEAGKFELKISLGYKVRFCQKKKVGGHEWVGGVLERWLN